MSDTLNKLINDIYSFLNDIYTNILIDNDYEIDTTAKVDIQIKQYLLRYRRIIGIIMLIILLYIMYYCNDYIYTIQYEKNLIQTGGDLAESAKMLKKIASDKRFAELKAESNKADALKAKVASEAEAATKKAAVFGKTKTGQAIAGTNIGSKITDMKNAGKSKAQIAYALGGMATDKFKEFATWLYEILFAIAISIAICMIVVPSLSFFALGLVCYFLFKSKISSIKGL